MSARNLSSVFIFYLAGLSLLIVTLHGILDHAKVLLALEALGLLTLLVVFWSGAYQGGTYKSVHWFLWVCIAMAGLYVVPIPNGFSLPLIDFDNLPGRQLYHEVDQWLAGQGVIAPYRTLSIIPYESTLALLALLPPLALFYTGISLSKDHLRNLIYLLLLIATIQAIIGLIQYASGNPAFYFGLSPGGRSAKGTYVNRDHFAALLEMTLPIAIGLMLYSVGRASYDRRHDKTSWILNQFLIFSFVAVLLFLAGIFARSRTGVFLIMVGVLVSSLVFAKHIGGKQSAGLAAGFATVAVGLAAFIGLIPVLNRFVAQNPVEDERFRIFEHTLEGIKEFFPWGSGPDTFSSVYRAFQPIEQPVFINNAHNDYLELLFEMGIFGVFIIIGFFLLYLVGWWKFAGSAWDRLRFVQVGAGIGMFLLLLHLLSDFILHEPMNTMIFALLSGVFFRKSSKT